MSEHDEVAVEESPNGVVVVRLNAPARRNALSGPMARAFATAVDAIASSARAVLVAGTGDAFCAGADVGILRGAGEGSPSARQDLTDIYGTFEALDSCPLPTVAAIRGAAVGAGLNLALACDVRVVADDAYLRSMFMKNHIHPAGNHLQRLLEAGGRQLAVNMAVLDTPVRGSDARAIGLASVAVAAEDVEEEAAAIASRAAHDAQLAQAIKSSIRTVLPMTASQAREYEADQQLQTLLKQYGDRR